jgi:hypothetical protein
MAKYDDEKLNEFYVPALNGGYNNYTQSKTQIEDNEIIGSSQNVEVDETFIGKLKGAEKKRAFHHNIMVVDNVSMAHIVPIVRDNIEAETHAMTDEANQYKYLAKTSPLIASFRTVAANMVAVRSKRI